MKTSRGFTLIELMITVAVIAILAAIALPNYNEHVRKSRRAQAKADVLELAQNFERRYTLDRSYGAAAPAGFTQSPRQGTAYYTIVVNPLTTTTYTITAAPTGGQVADKCKTLVLDHRGTKTVTGGASLPASDCW